jgi:hypothetical protein
VDAFVDFDKDKTPDCVDPDDDNDGETDGADCAPTNAAVNHAATEKCNSVDDDCSGVVDDSYATDALVWYLDADADGSGDATSSVTACKLPAGYTATPGDCDDTNKAAHPGASEVCLQGDEDCDGLADDRDLESPIDASTWSYDGDGDLFGDPANTLVACVQPDGYTELDQALDCDDTNSEANPNHPEVCNNGIDDNCDGTVDKDAGTSTWWPDRDGDGYGDGNVAGVEDCEPPDTSTTWVLDDLDCDDSDADVNPASGEVLDNGIDDDCDPGTPDLPDTGDPGDTDDTDAGDTDTASVDTSFDTDRPWSPPLDETGVVPAVGEACGCAQVGPAGAAFLGAGVLLLVRRRRRA